MSDSPHTTRQANAALPNGPVSVGASFEDSATGVFVGMRDALKALLEATPGPSGRSVELADTLGIHAKLAWQAHRVANAKNPLHEAANIPSPAGLERLLEAASRRGAPEQRIQAVQAVSRELAALIDTHAGSRREFDTMVGSLVEHGAEQIDLAQKRAAYRAQSHILGVQARTHLGCMINAPSANSPGLVDFIALRGLIGLRRFRRDTSWVISQTRVNAPAGGERSQIPPEPIDPATRSEFGASLLTKYCSQPLPEIRRVSGNLEHMTNIEIVGSGLGNASAVTCLIGDLFRDAHARYRSPAHRHHISNMRVRTPSKVLVHDVLIHEEWASEGVDPRLSVFSDHRDADVRLEDNLAARACDLLPLKETLEYLGKGTAVMRSRDVPRYEEMVDDVLGQVGWDPDRFHVYRTRIEYPVMPASVVIHFDLPERVMG